MYGNLWSKGICKKEALLRLCKRIDIPLEYNGPPVKTTLEKNIVNYGALNGSGAYVRYAALVTAKLAAYTFSGVA